MRTLPNDRSYRTLTSLAELVKDVETSKQDAFSRRDTGSDSEAPLFGSSGGLIIHSGFNCCCDTLPSVMSGTFSRKRQDLHPGTAQSRVVMLKEPSGNFLQIFFHVVTLASKE